jgi:hypothetical protein
MTPKFELTFAGSPGIKFKREHSTYEAAKDEANRVYDQIIKNGSANRIGLGGMKAIVYGPGLHKEGQIVWG